MGVKSPAVDAMIAALLKAKSREDFVAAVRALDRVLISGFYVIPLFHLPAQWVARWETIAFDLGVMGLRHAAACAGGLQHAAEADLEAATPLRSPQRRDILALLTSH